MYRNNVLNIFGENLLAKESLMPVYKELLGVSGIKPFECVGTPEEVKLAFYNVLQKGEYNDDVVMKMFVKEVLPTISNIKSLEEEVYQLGDDLMPEEFKSVVY